MNIIDLIKNERKHQNKTQKEIADLIGITQAGYSAIEVKKSKLSAEDLLLICNYLNIDLNNLNLNNENITISITKEEVELFKTFFSKILNKIEQSNDIAKYKNITAENNSNIIIDSPNVKNNEK